MVRECGTETNRKQRPFHLQHVSIYAHNTNPIMLTYPDGVLRSPFSIQKSKYVSSVAIQPAYFLSKRNILLEK